MDSAIKKMVAAVIIFMVPIVVGMIAKYTSEDFEYMRCIDKATLDGIQEAKVGEVTTLVVQAEKTYSKADYDIALTALNNLNDSNEKNVLLQRMAKIKDVVALKNEVELLSVNGNEDDYNRLVKKVNALPASAAKNDMIKKLQQMKQRLDSEKRVDASKATEGINNGGNASKALKNNKNVSLNYFVSTTGQGFAYWLYVPENPDNDLPTVIYIHGLGERGDDYHNNTDLGIYSGPIREILRGTKKWNAIFIQPQIPSGDRSQNYGRSIVELTTKIVKNLKGDMKKISISGFSNGCYGVMVIVPQFPTYFSSAVAMGCSTTGVSPSGFSSTPLWMFVGAGDGASTMPGFAEQVKAVNGGQAWYTKVNHNSHNIVNDNAPEYSVFVDQKVVEWMISKKRN